MDGQILKAKDIQPGITVPPFHPNCRCTTAPVDEFADEDDTRLARNEDGETFEVPADMTFEEWKKQFASGTNDGIIKSLEVDDFSMMSEIQDIREDVSGVISSTIKEFEKKGGMFISQANFGDYYDEETGQPALFQVVQNSFGLTELNVNVRLLGGKSLEEINRTIRATKDNLPKDLVEAVVHECGHAKAYYGKSVSEIRRMNLEIKSLGDPSVSIIAGIDGAECIAEVEVLLYRGEAVPEKAAKLYTKYVRGGKA